MTSTMLTYFNLTIDQAARIAQIVAGELSRDSHGKASDGMDLTPDRNGATEENGYVDRSAPRADRAGQDTNALSGQIETRNSDDTVDETASLAAREGEQVAALHSEQDGSAFAAVTSPAQLANAIGAEPLPSFISSPAFTAGDDGHPSTPTIDARAAGQGESSHCMAQSIEAVTNLRERKPLRPFCQSPDDLTKCAGVGAKHCHACTKAMAQSEAA